VCGARRAKDGAVIPLNYGRCTSLALDPIEKKPLARFYPGSTIYSYGSFGCNLSCSYCQNWEIAQPQSSVPAAGPPGRRWDTRTIHESHPAFTPVPTRYLSPTELVMQAEALKPRGNLGVALTYNEPLISPEYLMDVAEEAHTQDLKLVLVTNGYVMPTMAEQVFGVVDAANIDLKAFNQDFYTMVGAPGGLATVKQTIQIALAQGCHVEITTLVIPGLSDSPEEMAEEAAWIASLDPGIPLHISRFHPAHNMMDRPPTPRETIKQLAQIAGEHLTHVYTGNM